MSSFEMPARGGGKSLNRSHLLKNNLIEMASLNAIKKTYKTKSAKVTNVRVSDRVFAS